MNLVFFNYSVHSINPFQMSYVGPAGDASTKPEAEAVQEARWEELVKRVANEDGTPNVPFTSRVKTWDTIAGNTKLTENQVKNLQANNGGTIILFLTITIYEDASGEHELDSCMFVQDMTTTVHNCAGHNGPAEPVPHRPLHEKKWYFLWLN